MAESQARHDAQAAEEGRPLWVLHDGPPYANGNLHIGTHAGKLFSPATAADAEPWCTGHALNKILKDIINRYKLLRGYRVHYVPGWDTHGLPLELKALSNFKAPARSLSPLTVRAAARLEALDGIDTQRSEFTQFALLGQWGDELGYKTLEWSYERKQLELFRDMVTRGASPAASSAQPPQLLNGSLRLHRGHLDALPSNALLPLFSHSARRGRDRVQRLACVSLSLRRARCRRTRAAQRGHAATWAGERARTACCMDYDAVDASWECCASPFLSLSSED